MTLNFPSSPTTGQTHNATNGLSYYYDGVKWTTQGTYASSAGAQQYKIDDISSDFNGTTTTFDLHHNSSNISISSALDVTISVGGVLQEPDIAYTVNPTASTITFSEAPETGTTFFGVLKSKLADTNVTVSDGAIVNSKLGGLAVTTDKLANDSVNSAKIIDGSIVNADVNSSAAIDATKLSFTQTGTGALPRTIASKLQESFSAFSVKDFGATGDGTTDDTTACQNAVNAALATKNGTVFFPPGTYKLTDALGSVSTPASTTSIALIGDERAVLDFQPSVYLNYGIAFNSGASDTVGYKVVHIEGLTIDCNNKVASAIVIRFQNTGTSGATLPKHAVVKDCKIENVKGVNNVAVTYDALAIQIQGYENAEVTNNFIKNVVRDKNANGCDATRGITIQDCHITNITNNYIEDISHGGQGSPSDSDGIVVFSNAQNSKYDRDLVNISNNYIKDCDGRFLKLQTNGLCTVSGNLMKLEQAMTLIEYWKGIDVQAGNSTIVNNKMHIGSEYGGAGGANSMLLQIQRANDAGDNADYNNEGHVTLIKDNVFNLEKKIKYGIGLEPIAESTQMTLIYKVHNNTIQGGSDSDITGSDTTTIRPDYFIYAGGGSFPQPDIFTGKMIWDIRDNMVDCLDFLHLSGGKNLVATETVVVGDDTLTLKGHGVPTSAVNTSTEVITAASHGLATAQAVRYYHGGGTVLAGLADDTTYYVIKVDDNSYKLATDATNANAGTAINLTGTGNNAQYITPFHQLSTGDKIVYNNGGGTTLAGLSNKYPYYVINVNGYKIKLATTAANASAGTAINLTGQGTDAQWFVHDHAGHWFLYVINNTKWPTGITRDLLGQEAGEVQTSSLCVSGNTNGKESLNVDYSIDFSDLMAGCNFGAGAGMRSRNGPGIDRSSNIRKERCWVVENEKQTFTSTDPTAGWDYDDPAEELTIASGAITVTGKLHNVDTESDASTDDLDTINGGVVGQIVILRAADDGRTIVCKDGTGNLKLSGDFSLTHTEDGIVLIHDGTNWIELSTANNAS